MILSLRITKAFPSNLQGVSTVAWELYRGSKMLSDTWWLGGKESICQGRRLGFEPWVGKIPWRRKRQPTPIFLPGKSHGQRSLAGHSPQSCNESDTTEHAHICSIIFETSRAPRRAFPSQCKSNPRSFQRTRFPGCPTFHQLAPVPARCLHSLKGPTVDSEDGFILTASHLTFCTYDPDSLPENLPAPALPQTHCSPVSQTSRPFCMNPCLSHVSISQLWE